MLLVSYDISNDKVRNKFSRFLSKFGFRLQYSVFEITNIDTVLSNIENEIQNVYMKAFTEEDSVIIFNLSATCKKTCYGYAKNEETARYAEYGNKGEGASTKNRVKWSKQLTKKEAAKVTLLDAFGEDCW